MEVKDTIILSVVMRWLKWDKLYLVATSVDDQRCYEILKDFNENTILLSEGGDIILSLILMKRSVDELYGCINNVVFYNDVIMLDKQSNPTRIFS